MRALTLPAGGHLGVEIALHVLYAVVDADPTSGDNDTDDEATSAYLGEIQANLVLSGRVIAQIRLLDLNEL